MVLASSRSAYPSRIGRSPSFARKGAALRLDLLAGIPMTPTSVGQAFHCLTEVSARLRSEGDPRAAFTDVYAVITRRVRDAIEGPADECPFVEPQFISRLAGRFCTLYLGALRRSIEGSDEPIHAWTIANRGDRSRPLLPVQQALLGLNAHINYDLALGLFDNVISLGAHGDEERLSRYHHDHDAVNQILEDAIPEVLCLLANRYGCTAASLVLRADELQRAASGFTMTVLRAWRARVWRDLLRILAARDEGSRGRLLGWMNLRAGFFASLLRMPLPLAERADDESGEPAGAPLFAAA